MAILNEDDIQHDLDYCRARCFPDPNMGVDRDRLVKSLETALALWKVVRAAQKYCQMRNQWCYFTGGGRARDGVTWCEVEKALGELEEK